MLGEVRDGRQIVVTTEVIARSGSRAGSGNVAAVLRNLRLHKNNIEHLPSPQNRTFRQNYPNPLAHLLYVITSTKSIQKIQIFELFIVFTKMRHLGAKFCEKCGLDFVFSSSYPENPINWLSGIGILPENYVSFTVLPFWKSINYTKTVTGPGNYLSIRLTHSFFKVIIYFRL